MRKKPIKKKSKIVPLRAVLPKGVNIMLRSASSSAGGEVDCPKGWGKVKFSDSGFCPISAAQFCKDCEYKENPEKSAER